MIRRVNDKMFFVKSQSSDDQYKVQWRTAGKWQCGCPDYIKSKNPCKHVYAVNYLLRLPEILLSNMDAIEGVCPECGSNEITSYGNRFNKSGAVKRYRCSKCRSTFKNPVSYQNLNGNIGLILIALDLYYKKVSLRDIKGHLWQVYGVEKPVSTIHGWIQKFTKMFTKAVAQIEPDVTDARMVWHADEMVVKIKGKKYYLWNVLDSASRVLVVSLLFKGRGSKEASKVIRAAIQKVGRPEKIVTDGLSSYEVAAVQNNIPHLPNVGIANKQNNNKIERLHCSIRSFIKAKRGLRSQETLHGLQDYYNHVRPHQSLDERPPLAASTKRWTELLLVSAPPRRRKTTQA